MHPDSRVYVLGLSPNAARLSVRFWVDQPVLQFARHFQEHWADLRVEPRPPGPPPPLWRLLLELAPRRKSENILPELGGEIMRAILTGLPYPRALLIQTILRIRADGDINPVRVALAKATLARAARRAHTPSSPAWKDTLVALDLLLRTRLVGEMDASHDSLRFYNLGRDGRRRLEHVGIRRTVSRSRGRPSCGGADRNMPDQWARRQL